MEPTPEDYVALLRQIRNLVEVQHAATMRNWQESRLQPGAGKLLAELSYRGEARVSDLAEQRFVDASVVSRQAAQLEKLGLIERRRAPEDGRVALLRVTDEGNRILESWRKRQTDMLANALKGWDKAKLAEATDLLKEISEDFRTLFREAP
jgi:DNA-binding MarR family transcriptional regulator